MANVDDLTGALFLKEAKAIVSVCEVDHHPLWTNTLPEDGCMKDFIRQKIMNKNKQELPVFYRLNGAIYLTYCNYIKKYRSFISP
jgi:N-acylneuraminate cytidylyltransferase/CMP-N,N'-diacetyllegionaminic acid synthase